MPEIVCESTHRVTAGETYLDVAWGFNVESIRRVTTGGQTVTTTSWWNTESVIRTATASAATAVAVWHPQVVVLMEAAPTETSATSDGFTLWGLGTVFTVVALVGISIGVLILLCGCWCYCRRGVRPRHAPTHTSSYTSAYTPPVRTSPYISAYTQAYTPARHTPTHTSSYTSAYTPPAQDCEHGRSSSCSDKSSPSDSTCCACRDRRLAPMTIASRTATYCIPCKRSWATCSPSDVPAKWKSGNENNPPSGESARRPMDRWRCRHGIVAAGCSRNAAGSKNCCACKDTRRGLVTKEERVRTYCRPCAGYYRKEPADKSPTEWRLANIQCPHSRSKACEQSSKFEAACCVCKDTRTGTISRRDRTAVFCKICASHWNSVPVSSLPASWGIRCSHGAAFSQQCRTHSSRGKCCACQDTRSKNMPKQTRTKTYCTPCKTAWGGRPDARCPPEWGLLNPRRDCAHSMALECTTSNAGEASCCACQDRRKFLLLHERLRSGYCAPCRQRWERGGDGVPPSWLVAVKDLPLRNTIRDRCLRPVTTYPSENTQNTHRRIFDQGPRYGEPRFGGAQDNDAQQDKPSSDRSNRWRLAGTWEAEEIQTPAWKMGLLGPLTDKVEIHVPPSPQDTAPYEGYKENGPLRNPYGPRILVPVSVPPASPTPVSESSAEKPARTKRAPTVETSSNASAPLREAEKQRRRDREGLCMGKPNFVVPAND